MKLNIDQNYILSSKCLKKDGNFPLSSINLSRKNYNLPAHLNSNLFSYLQKRKNKNQKIPMHAFIKFLTEMYFSNQFQLAASSKLLVASQTLTQHFPQSKRAR